jgi:(p)ppGpp synthase/HD superfamily hydrolase
MLEDFRKRVYDLHDIECNQKYGDELPYSFHLKAVEAQFSKFQRLLPCDFALGSNTNLDVFLCATIMHDTMEDARMTYNDIVDFIKPYITKGSDVQANFPKMVADIVYCLTDEKGKNRAERKNEKYYKELSENKYAVFIKLADIAANTLYSKLTGSSMYNKYKKEFPKFKDRVYKAEYEEFFNYVENL